MSPYLIDYLVLRIILFNRLFGTNECSTFYLLIT